MTKVKAYTIEDLKRLDDEIWDVVPADPYSHNIYERFGQVYEKRDRQITNKEWDAIVEAIERLDLVVSLHNACRGFGVGACIYEQQLEVPGVSPTYIINVTSNHFDVGGKKSFDFAWERFLPLAATERNTRLLAYYKMKPVREKVHYEY